MKLEYTHTYEADPQGVVALMRTKEFLEDVATHAGATSQEVQVADDHTTLAMRLPVPGGLTKFVGETIGIAMVFRFGDVRPDGVVPGTVEVDVPGMPVDVAAAAELRPSGSHTVARYEGDLKVRIPLVGKKVESQVEPFITDAFAGLERRAKDWLAR